MGCFHVSFFIARRYYLYARAYTIAKLFLYTNLIELLVYVRIYARSMITFFFLRAVTIIARFD